MLSKASLSNVIISVICILAHSLEGLKLWGILHPEVRRLVLVFLRRFGYP